MRKTRTKNPRINNRTKNKKKKKKKNKKKKKKNNNKENEKKKDDVKRTMGLVGHQSQPRAPFDAPAEGSYHQHVPRDPRPRMATH